MQGSYKVITLCGSTHFKDQFIEAQKRLTLEGYIGRSTKSEIEYAKRTGKPVRYLEDPDRRKRNSYNEKTRSGPTCK